MWRVRKVDRSESVFCKGTPKALHISWLKCDPLFTIYCLYNKKFMGRLCCNSWHCIFFTFMWLMILKSVIRLGLGNIMIRITVIMEIMQFLYRKLAFAIFQIKRFHHVAFHFSFLVICIFTPQTEREKSCTPRHIAQACASSLTSQVKILLTLMASTTEIKY